MNFKQNFPIAMAFTAVSTAAVLVVACGGGGKGGGGSSTPTLPGLITATAIVDVNGDGKNDIIVGSQGGGFASDIVLINNGNGSVYTIKTSAIPTQYKGVNGSAVDIQSGDFNNDGKIDLLVSTVDTTPSSFYSGAQIQLFLGKGDGTFTDATANITCSTSSSSVTPSNPVCPARLVWPDHLRVVDVDGDGFLDFIATSSSVDGGAIFRNDGTGHFAPVQISITNSSNATTYTSGGPLPTSWTSYLLGAAPPSANGFIADALVGDVDNNGKPDVVSPYARGTFINTSTIGSISFSFKPFPNWFDPYFTNGVLVDINGDGYLDLVGSQSISSTTSTVPVYAFINDGAGVFTEDSTVFLPSQPGVVHARQWLTADFDGDGKKDVLIADHGYDGGNYPGARNWLLFNNGAGKLVDVTAANLDLLPGYTHQASIGDLNGDGKLDIVLNNSSNCNGCVNEPRFWLNDGTGKFTSYNPTLN